MQHVIAAQLAARSWDQLSAWELVALFDDVVGVQEAITHFPPPSLATLPRSAVRCLFLQMFLINANVRLLENPYEDFGFPVLATVMPYARPMFAAICPLWFDLAVPHVRQEIDKRIR